MRKKWRCQFLSIGGDQIWLLTPWFCFQASYGGLDFITGVFWWGLRVSYAPNWNVSPGALVFQKEWQWIRLWVPRERVFEMGGTSL